MHFTRNMVDLMEKVKRYRLSAPVSGWFNYGAIVRLVASLAIIG